MLFAYFTNALKNKSNYLFSILWKSHLEKFTSTLINGPLPLPWNKCK